MIDFKSMGETDLKLFLLSGRAIKVGGVSIEPYKIGDIRDYGYSKYMESIQWSSVGIDDFMESIVDEDKKKVLEDEMDNLRTLDFYMRLGGSDMQKKIVSILSTIFKTQDMQILEGDIIAVDFVKDGILKKSKNGLYELDEEIFNTIEPSDLKVVHRENFDDIMKVVRLQNYLEKPTDAVDSSMDNVDEETRKLLEQMEKMKKKVEEKKKISEDDDDRDVDISDIISAVSSKSNSINKLNVWELTLYQIYDEYSRLELIDSYDFNIRAMMAGAKEVDLKHWSSKI